MNSKKSFPKVSHKCNACGVCGKEDVSYHGSPDYETCTTCKGEKNKIFYRDMTTNEKLDYLLNKL